MKQNILFDFNQNSNLENWTVVDDVVMGGKSIGNFRLNEDGFGVFSGYISLENNGGFSSVRYRFENKSTKEYTKIILKIKGDGKKYQFRIKTNSSDNHSYISVFTSNGEWQEIEILLETMTPKFRGKKLDIPNFDGKYIEEIAFLIGNKNQEHFQLLIDKIEFS